MSGMSTNALLPSGTPLEGGALAPPEPPNPLLGLGPGLQEALLLMDYAINQNNYLPQLLLYRWAAACIFCPLERQPHSLTLRWSHQEHYTHHGHASAAACTTRMFDARNAVLGAC